MGSTKRGVTYLRMLAAKELHYGPTYGCQFIYNIMTSRDEDGGPYHGYSLWNSLNVALRQYIISTFRRPVGPLSHEQMLSYKLCCIWGHIWVLIVCNIAYDIIGRPFEEDEKNKRPVDNKTFSYII